MKKNTVKLQQLNAAKFVRGMGTHFANFVCKEIFLHPSFFSKINSDPITIPLNFSTIFFTTLTKGKEPFFRILDP